MTSDLDDINFDKRDPKRVVDQLESFAIDCRNAWKMIDDLAIPSYYVKAKQIVILGMGGSGISAETIKDLMYDSDVSIEVVHDYQLPGYVDENTLVIASSYSGNTEETLATFVSAYEQNAKLIAITTGGKLETLARKYNVPLFLFDYKSQPRMAFSYLFTSILAIMVKLGHMSLPTNFENICKDVEDISSRFKISQPEKQNPAKMLAKSLQGRLPVIYASPLLKAAGNRFKCQFNENTKSLAFCEFFPELNHNGIEGYSNPKIPTMFLFLESNFENDRVALRQEITSLIIRKHNLPLERIKFSQSSNRLVETLLMISFCDYVSYYLAVLYSSNPGEVETIKFLKDRLEPKRA